MTEIIVIDTDSDGDSIQEIEPPRKPSPTVIDVEDNEIVLNINQSVASSTAIDGVRNEVVLDVNRSNATTVIGETISEEDNDYPSHWTKDMIKFYNEDWGGEDEFSVEMIQAKMNKHPSLWCTANKRGRRYWNNFNQKFHKARSKVFPSKPNFNILDTLFPKCHMCGEPGHNDKNCPKSICLNCGNHMKKFVINCDKCLSESNVQCSRCSLYGHHYMNCSDNWRRFHITTGTTDVNIPSKPPYKLSEDMWCCNCGRKGHNQIYCDKANNKGLLAFDTAPFVASYETSFNETLEGQSVVNQPVVKQKGKKSNKKSKKKTNKIRRMAQRGLQKRNSGWQDWHKYQKFIRSINTGLEKKLKKANAIPPLMEIQIPMFN